MRERGSGANSEEVNDLQRELQTVLGTAKWQVGFLYYLVEFIHIFM
jgi:hypothetical protein